jgi:hypothetical protein
MPGPSFRAELSPPLDLRSACPSSDVEPQHAERRMDDIERNHPGEPYAEEAPMGCYEFTAELWIWDARKEGSWTFLSVPPEESEDIHAYTARASAVGFGSVRVSVTIGSSTWETSIFPGGADGTYALPIKKSVRRVEGIEAGDVVAVRLCTVER